MPDCICHFAVKSIQRSQGRSVTASVAYRDGDKIKDERTGETFDYTHRSGVEHSENIIPEGMIKSYTNSELWNAAELAERKSNSVVGREYVVALPCELTPEERKKLAVEFARKIVERYGVAANVAVHKPGKEGDHRNYHAHIMTSTRVLRADGFGAKTRILDVRQTSRVEISALRDMWAGMSNAYLERAGSDRRMDARSFAERGMEREPEIHLGPTATAIERRHGRWERAGAGPEPPVSERGDANRKVRELNALIAERDALSADIGGREEPPIGENRAEAAEPTEADATAPEKMSPAERLKKLREQKARLGELLEGEAERIAEPMIATLRRENEIKRELLDEAEKTSGAILAALDEEYKNLPEPDMLDSLPIVGGLLSIAGWNRIDKNADWERRHKTVRERHAKAEEALKENDEGLEDSIKAERVKARREAKRRYPEADEAGRKLDADIAALEREIGLARNEREQRERERRAAERAAELAARQERGKGHGR